MKKKKEKKIRYADSRYAVTPLLVTPLRRLLTPLVMDTLNYCQVNKGGNK